ncbi:MAG: hypothetical protein AABW51_03705 [Nanoarchaeota archaeon]
MIKGKLSPLSTNVLIERADFLHDISYSGLIKLVNAGSKFPSEAKTGLDILVDAGLLSESTQGNYSITSRMDSEIVINPHLGGRVFYFTLNRDVRGFASILGFQTNIAQQGLYVVPETLIPIDWKTIYFKGNFENDGAQIAGNLLNRKLLSKDFFGNYAIAASSTNSSSEDRSYLKFKSYQYFFTDKKTALDFAKSLHGPRKAIVVDHRKKIVLD